MSVLVQTLMADALFEVQSLSPGEPIPVEVGTVVLSRLNQIIDNWNAEREAVYSEQMLDFTFVPSQQVYTIGPDSADFDTPIRPVSIEGANVILTTTPPVYNAINIRDYQWWMRNTVRQVSTTFPTDLYYQPLWDSPTDQNGQINFYPIPTTTYGVELWVRTLLTSFTPTSTLSMPPGYQNAVMLTLAEDIAPMLGKTLTQTTMSKAREARARIFRNNAFTPQIATQDFGMPRHNRNRTSWNYLTGINTTFSR